MSMSVAGSSQAQQSYLQQLQQQGSVNTSGAVAAPDMLSELMQASGSSNSSDQTSSTTDTSATSSSTPAFSTDALNTLLSLQDQSSNGSRWDPTAVPFLGSGSTPPMPSMDGVKPMGTIATSL